MAKLGANSFKPGAASQQHLPSAQVTRVNPAQAAGQGPTEDRRRPRSRQPSQKDAGTLKSYMMSSEQ